MNESSRAFSITGSLLRMYAFKSKLPSPLTVDAGADSGAAVLCILLLVVLVQLVLDDVDVNASTEEKDVARRTNPTLKEERMVDGDDQI